MVLGAAAASERHSVMRQDGTILRATPAQVLGFLSEESVYVVAPYVRLGLLGFRNTHFETKWPVPRDLWPDELLRLNADVWLIEEHDKATGDVRVIEVCPRTDFEPPEKYRQLLDRHADSDVPVSATKRKPTPEERAKRRREAGWERQWRLGKRPWWEFWRWL
jgi:hypothetical protein